MSKNFLCYKVLLFLFTLNSLFATDTKLTPEQLSFFEKNVRPVLANNCYECHSAKEGRAKSGFTLDTAKGLLLGGNRGPAIIPGSPAESLLIKAVRHEHDEVHMPKDREKLSEQVIADLVRWIEMGAPDPRSEEYVVPKVTESARKHWAYQKIVKHQPPKNAEHPIDGFIRSKLEENGLSPAEPADRIALIRRATFDLTGLPPTQEEVRAFVRDPDPDAFTKVVDRLLRSPRYGENWGRYWLDLARYSDTTGNANFRRATQYPYAWTYRNYVIESFNEDKPFDRFIHEQIAADQLGLAPDDSDLAALGFLTIGPRFEDVENDIIDDRIDVVSRVFLAVTVACARCHDHKFDPIPTQDYYSLHGVFASSFEKEEKPLLNIHASEADRRDYLTERKQLENAFYDAVEKQIQHKLNTFYNSAGAYLLAWLHDKAESNKIYKQYGLDPVSPVRIVKKFYNKRKAKASSVVYPMKALKELSKKNKDFTKNARDLVNRIDNEGVSGRDAVNPYIMAALKGSPLRNMDDVVAAYTSVFKKMNAQWKPLIEAYEGSFKATGKRVPFPRLSDSDWEEIRLVPFQHTKAASLESALIAADKNFLKYLQSSMLTVREGAHVTNVLDRVNRLEMTHPGAPARAMVLVDRKEPKDSPILVRGEPKNFGRIVPRRFLEVLSPTDRKNFDPDSSGRLELAQAITATDNPLTARVLVNRVWQHHFGEGLVRTPDDFGFMADSPSHPKLLDYLAARFVEEGWSVKKLHRTIMLSETYQQRYYTNRAYAEIDPKNRFLWRANIRRLEFEQLRDALLTIGGNLEPFQLRKPVNIFSEPLSYSRSVYGFIDRRHLPETLNIFDFANPDTALGKRQRTIVPQQALFMMNNPLVVDTAKRLIQREEIHRIVEDDKRVVELYRIIFGRDPNDMEVKTGLDFIFAIEQEKGEDIAEGSPMAQEVKKVAVQNVRYNGPRNEGEIVERGTLNPWETYAQSLLMSNELVFLQ